MGMQQDVMFPEDAAWPTWQAVCDRLAERGVEVQMRMIDGELAMPDEAPPERWHELRVATEGGMITLRREGRQLSVITFDNAEATLRQGWNVLAWAFAAAGAGEVVTPEARLSANAFADAANLPGA